MNKNLKILINYCLYFISFFIICIIGITGVFAYTYENVGYVTDKTNVQVEVNYTAQPLPVAQNQHVQLQEVYSIDIFVTNIDFSPDYTYQFELYTPNFVLTGANSATVVDQTGSTDKNCRVLSTQFTNDYPQLTFKCDSSSNIRSLYIRYYNSSNGYLFEGSRNWYWNYAFFRRRVNDTDDNTGEITDSIQNNTNNIINNNNNNTQSIINNNDENTNKIIDENKKNFNDCRDSVNLIDMSYLTTQTINGVSITNNNGVITLNGTANNIISMQISSNLYNLSIGNYYFQNFNSGSATERVSMLFYGRNNNAGANILLNFDLRTNNSTSYSLSTQYDNYYLWLYIPANTTINNLTFSPQLEKGNTASSYEQYGEEICVNKLDEQKNAINNVDNTLKDDNVDDNGVADAFESFNDYLDDNSTITQLITLPITLYTAILNNLNGSCSPFNLGELYGESLILPCINISQYLGNSLWTMIDIIISGFAVYAISKKMIKVFNNFSSLREGDVIDD